MSKILQLILLAIGLAVVTSKDPELPLCPTNILQYFPQQLPMHCRMPPNANNMAYQAQPMPNMQMPAAPIYQSPPSDKQPNPIPIPVPPGFPGPLSMPMPMPMPLPAPRPASKLPVIVMPFYSPDRSYNAPKDPVHRPQKPWKRKIEVNKFRRPRYDSSDTDSDTSDTDASSETDTSSDSSNERRGWWKGYKSGRRSNKRHKSRKHRNKKKGLLTPILQYVTKDGYVIFEKKITKGEAKDWLGVKKYDADDSRNLKKDNNNINDENDVEIFDTIPNQDEAIAPTEREREDENIEVITERNPLRKHRPHKSNKMAPNKLLEPNK